MAKTRKINVVAAPTADAIDKPKSFLVSHALGKDTNFILHGGGLDSAVLLYYMFVTSPLALRASTIVHVDYGHAASATERSAIKAQLEVLQGGYRSEYRLLSAAPFHTLFMSAQYQKHVEEQNVLFTGNDQHPFELPNRNGDFIRIISNLAGEHSRIFVAMDPQDPNGHAHTEDSTQPYLDALSSELAVKIDAPLLGFSYSGYIDFITQVMWKTSIGRELLSYVMSCWHPVAHTTCGTCLHCQKIDALNEKFGTNIGEAYAPVTGKSKGTKSHV